VRLTASVADGATHTIALRFVDDDMKTVGILASSVIEFQDAGPGRGLAASVRFSIGPMGFPRAGDYTLVILADGQKVGGVPLAALEPNEPPT